MTKYNNSNDKFLEEVLRIDSDLENDIVVALAGNPNTGKSTVFNSLTGLNQHTGNWPGKTVSNAQGKYTYKNKNYILVDLPGSYSLLATSVEEEIARDFIVNANPDITVVITDATSLERNLNLVLQILEITDKAVVCVNLIDEAKRKKIEINLEKLENLLGVPVIGTCARSGKGLEKLKEKIEEVALNKIELFPIQVEYENPTNTSEDSIKDSIVSSIFKTAEDISNKVVHIKDDFKYSKDDKIDNILTSRKYGIPIMIILLGIIFWITIEGANIPSDLLAKGLFFIENKLSSFFRFIGTPEWLHGILVLGIYRTLAWVISVMLPPMAIFFPLFTLLEDLGYLPRVAFNLDYYFKKACAHGKQALTMCMGFGCNAAGVIACRIIDSPRERLIAIITNNFVPCNGRFPILIAIAAIFIGSSNLRFSSILATFSILVSIILGVVITLFISKLLSKTILKGLSSAFILELPPYRKPQVGKVIVHSIFDRTLFVLARAIIVAAPAGFIIWIMANITIGDLSLLSHSASFLDPFSKLIGLDGYILMAFILGLPANEIVIPILIMSYMSTGSMLELDSLNEMGQLFINHGWTPVTAICTMLFTLNHWPCATTLLTIKKETGSLKWTFLSFIIPTITGIIICFIVAQGANLLGII